MQRIYNILTSILGESKQGGYDSGVNQYQFNCPHCADEKGGVDNKFNLEISFTLGKFHCWSCGSAGSISRLIKLRGGKPLVDEYFRIITDIKENKFYDLNLFKDNGDIFEETYLKLPKTFKKIDIATCKDKALLAYLDKRKITKEQKNLIDSIIKEINNLPDRYIDTENISDVLSNALEGIEKYNKYVRKYYQIPVIDTNVIEKHNEKYITSHLSDNIFDNINGKSLDEEQRRAVLCDSKANLTIAGAGSGKTLTICGKVKYLLETGLAREDEILLLSYKCAAC